MAFKDLGDWADAVGLQLPIKGKTYTLPLVPAELGLRIVAILQLGEDLKKGSVTDADRELLNDTEERDLYKDILGDAHAQMCADGVPWEWLKHAANTAMIDVVQGRDAAELFWEIGLGKLLPAKKPVKRPTDRKAPQARKATESRTATASTAGTTPRTRKTATSATRGRNSSRSGT